MYLQYWVLLLQILVIAALDCEYASGEWNQSCVTDKYSCSVCCVDHKCLHSVNFPNECSFGCIDGHRGARCYELCTYNCKNCHYDISKCESCYDGFYPGDNKDCKAKCLSTCKNCSSGTSCNTCKEGFFNKYGYSDCRYTACPESCVCNNSVCVACKSGSFDISKLCSSRCPINCLECSSNLQCSSCKDGFFNDNGLTKICSRSCRNNCTICSSYNECLQCQPGKFGKKCHEQCSVGCKNNVCEIETGTCKCIKNFSGENCTECVSGKFGVSCERICPYNCNNTICGKSHGECTKGCKSDKMTGTYCENCVVGKYGTSCDDICPEKCLNNKCYKENGTCTEGCKEGFEGLYCSRCVLGKYGDECNYDCPGKCKGNKCENESGHCFNCTVNFDGNMCDICKPGFYGSGCDRICSLKCVNATCDKDSGKCIRGCEDNYSGDKCCVNSESCLLCESNTICQKCSPGYYGQTCNQTCSVLCIKNVCEMNTGICTEGCKAFSNNMICLRNQGNRQDDTKLDFKDIIIAAVGGATFTLCMLIVVIKIRKCLLTRRSHKDTMVLNDIEGGKTEIENMLNGDNAVGKGNEPYERLSVDRLGRETDDLETYVNLQI